MAILESLRVRNLRCIRSADLRLAPGLIWVSGSNGAGKTTLLEAIYVLDRLRTFRGRRSGPLTTRGEQATAIGGSFLIGGRCLQRRWTSSGKGDAALPIPMTRFVGAASFNIVEGDPALRRRLLDWSLFHVEPGARALWAKLQRVHRQRNAWLRAGGAGKPIWDGPYATALDAVWHKRSAFLARVNREFREVTGALLPRGEVLLSLHWTGQSKDLHKTLAEQLPGDKERGYTFLSASRGDISFSTSSGPWTGSRGENKLVGLLLQLAFQNVISAETGAEQIALLDDPYAEVSSGHVNAVLWAWSRACEQLVVTSLEEHSPPTALAQTSMLFHVKQGVLSTS